MANHLFLYDILDVVVSLFLPLPQVSVLKCHRKPKCHGKPQQHSLLICNLNSLQSEKQMEQFIFSLRVSLSLSLLVTDCPFKPWNLPLIFIVREYFLKTDKQKTENNKNPPKQQKISYDFGT